MKLPTRTIAIVLWIIGIGLVGNEWLSFHRAVYDFPQATNTTYYVIFRIGAAVTYFAGMFGLGAIVWVLGEIRDRLPERH